MSLPEKVLVALPRRRGELASHVRSTLLLSSIQSLRQKALWDRYAEALDPAVRETLVSCVAGVWLPMTIGIAHYEACHAIGLSLQDEVAMGYQVGERIQGSLVGLLVRAAKGAGTTPWALLTNVNRLWDRVFQGGAGASLTEVGPKEARVELVGLPLLQVPYFRHAYRGTFLAAVELFAEKAYVSEIGRRGETSSTTYRISWA
ncbi:MAG TPA: hypothetical protein VGI39_39585 [Polyangiaceae bacterium]